MTQQLKVKLLQESHLGYLQRRLGRLNHQLALFLGEQSPELRPGHNVERSRMPIGKSVRRREHRLAGRHRAGVFGRRRQYKERQDA